MADTELIAETNRLLKQLLEIDAQQREESKRAMEDLDKRQAELKTKMDESMAERLQKQGVSEENSGVSEAEWDARRKDAYKRTEENMELMRRKDSEYRDALLGEMKTQSELLRQIAEVLAR